jgi:hypothetical protein
MHAGFWWGKLKERVQLENLGVDRRILKWIWNSVGRAWTGNVWLRIGTAGGCYARGIP